MNRIDRIKCIFHLVDRVHPVNETVVNDQRQTRELDRMNKIDRIKCIFHLVDHVHPVKETILNDQPEPGLIAETRPTVCLGQE